MNFGSLLSLYSKVLEYVSKTFSWETLVSENRCSQISSYFDSMVSVSLRGIQPFTIQTLFLLGQCKVGPSQTTIAALQVRSDVVKVDN